MSINYMKKIFKIIGIIVFLFIMSGISSIIIEHYIFSKISSYPIFSRSNFLKKFTENTTIINRTEQVIVKEDSSVNKVASQTSASVASIISYSERKSPIAPKKNPSRPVPLTEKSGTGIIATSDGLIVTYRGAILESNAKYVIFFPNGSATEAQLVGLDDFSDLAYLKIESTNLTAISFSNSQDSFAGKKVIAIGNSLGEYQNRYAIGILNQIDKTFNISGTTLSSSEKLEGVFETDFTNKKEYIGSPVIDYNGELVGIIGSLMIDSQEKYFTIPSNTIKKSLELLNSGGLQSRPKLGIYYIPITKTYSIIHNLPKDKGALVYSSSGKQGLAVISGSPAEKSGIMINDIILSINDQEINLDNPLSNILSQHRKGDQIKLRIFRNQQETTLEDNL